MQVISTLGFLATGIFQRELGDRAGTSQASIRYALPRVVDGINRLAVQYMQLAFTAEKQVSVKRGLHSTAGLPNTISALRPLQIGLLHFPPQSCGYTPRARGCWRWCTLNNYKFWQEWASIPVMIYFMRKLRICPALPG